jgi:hypothetical protein
MKHGHTHETHAVRGHKARLTLIVAVMLLTAMVIGLWADRGTGLRSARAADQPFKDSISQRKELVTAVQTTNAKLDELIQLFRSGQVKVQIAGTGAGKGGEGNAKGGK